MCIHSELVEFLRAPTVLVKHGRYDITRFHDEHNQCVQHVDADGSVCIVFYDFVAPMQAEEKIDHRHSINFYT